MSVVWNGANVIRTIRKVSKDAVMSAVFLVQKDAILDVNVDTGRHRASISGAVSFQGLPRQSTDVRSFTSSKTGKSQLSTSEDGVESPKASNDEYIGVIGSNVEYAIYRELEKPSLRKSLDGNAGTIKKLFNNKLL